MTPLVRYRAADVDAHGRPTPAPFLDDHCARRRVAHQGQQRGPALPFGQKSQSPHESAWQAHPEDGPRPLDQHLQGAETVHQECVHAQESNENPNPLPRASKIFCRVVPVS